jgi:ADP-ribosylation factor family
VGRVEFYTYELGGMRIRRPTWRRFLRDIDAFVFVIDSAEVSRLHESKEELEVRFLSLSSSSLCFFRL